MDITDLNKHKSIEDGDNKQIMDFHKKNFQDIEINAIKK
jgi:hypothetical protein